MKLLHSILAISLLSLFSITARAYDYPVKDIPDSLKTDAKSVVREFNIAFSQSSKTNAVYSVTKVTTVLDKNGDNTSNFHFSGDKFQDLSKFSGILRDASGKIIRKIKKGDLTSSTISVGSLATDNFSMFYECQSPSYPYTVEYTYEVKLKDGIITYPRFQPTVYTRQSIEKASCKLEIPSDISIRIKSNLKEEVNKAEIGTKTIYSVFVEGISAMPSEKFSPSLTEYIPQVLFAPNDFCYDSQCGSMATWKDYGLWMLGLLKNRDVLPPALISKLKDITQEATTDREKVKIVFEYLQNNSRYISIQLGIGGLQPFEAATVAKTGFGDCKGLSNLMLAMLKAIDIPSNYCEIYSGDNRINKELYPDFSNVNQTNHVILLVPLKNDSIWLECTSQTIPFGFVHDGIAGHDALVITDKGGKICRLPSFTKKENKKETSLVLKISEDGEVDGSLSIIESLNSARYLSLIKSERDKQVAYINQNIKLPKLKIGQISISSLNNANYPQTEFKTDFEASDFVNKTGTRLFIPMCPIDKGMGAFFPEKRILDIVIDDESAEYDTITFNIPESYTAETLPKDLRLESKFGLFEVQIKQVGQDIVYTQKLELNSGRYDKANYKELKDFYAQINNALKRKLVLKKS